jgi:GNAT superfamily N-acetyltransferase
LRPTLTTRRAEPADLAAVEGLRQEAADWLAGKGLDQWQPGQPRIGSVARTLEAIERGECYLTYDGDELVGTITIDDRPDAEFWTEAERAEPAVYLHRMVIARRYAGRDLGVVLLDLAENVASRAGASWLRLDAWKTNTALHRYYMDQGFEHVRTVDLPHRGSGALFQRPVRPTGPATR